MNKLAKISYVTGLAGLIALPLEFASAAVDSITVTTRKRDELLLKVPVSVTAFTSQMIENSLIIGVEEIAQFTPGFEQYRSYQRAFERPIIRGKSVIFTGTSPTTSYFVNGAFFEGTATSLNLSEAERIEVIRGPQSALFGRATYAGAVNFITKLPGDEFTGKASATAASHDQYEFTGGLSGPVVEGVLSAGVYGRYYEYGSQFVSPIDGRTLGEEQNWSIAPTFVLNLSEDVQFVVRGIYEDRDDGPPALGLQPFRENNYGERTTIAPVPGQPLGYDAFGRASLGSGFEYFRGEVEQWPLWVNYVSGDLAGKVGETEEHYGVFWGTTWDVTDAFTFTNNLSLDVFERTQLKAGPDGEPNGGWRLGGIAVPGATDLSSYTIGDGSGGDGSRAAKFSSFVVNADERTESLSWDGRIDYDDGGRFRAMLGGYHYDAHIRDNERDIDFAALAASLTPAQEANIMYAFQNAINIEAALLCELEPGCDPTTGDANFGMAIATPALIVGTPAIDYGGLSIDDVTNWAVYGRAEFDLTDSLTVGFEGRYSWDTLETFFDNFRPTASAPDPFIDMVTFRTFTPRFTVEWDITENSMVYFVAARGNKPGGFNNDDVAVEVGLTSFGEEKVWSYEIGTKNSLFNDQLVVNLAGYYDKVSDYQLSTTVVSFDGLRRDSVIDNKGSVTIKGLELEIGFAPDAIEGLTMNLGYAFNDSSFGDDAVDRVLANFLDVLDDGDRNCSATGDITPLTPCSGSSDQVPASLEGNRIPRGAKHSLIGTIGYQANLYNDWDWFTRFDASYTGDRFVQVLNLAVIPDATVLNGQIGVQNENFRVTFWVKNLTDEDAPIAVGRNVENDARSRRAFLTFPRRGRQFGGTITARF